MVTADVSCHGDMSDVSFHRRENSTVNLVTFALSFDAARTVG